ncbi:hypothetical protein FNV43_RR26116 [Rhamnella rubrinervis]|uniref:glutathione transferase n=1 Tax=Rhamnella rubrinervis TaxID=2594499 RepID=A0A8K0DP76_9ROSA|nr:hypothetical protein FNV43_RR26116 [Rhamnella rubrinervis]
MGESDEVKLLGAWPSPLAIRARIAFNIKNVNYDFIQEDVEAKSELLLKLNPVHKRIPVLVHGDKPICESLIIVEYIDDVWSSGPSILPSDPYDRAIARFWATYIDEKWFSYFKGINATLQEKPKKAAVDQTVEGLLVLEEAFVKCSDGKPFFGGDQIGYLDLAMGGYLAWLTVTENMNGIKLLDQAKTPQLLKWAERFRQHPAVIGVMPETERLTEYANYILPKMRGDNPPK